jgi:spectrin beta
MHTNGGTQLKRINDMADELVSEGHSQSDNIRARRHRINQIWNDLQKIMKQKAEGLETAEQLAAFNENINDTRAWMDEKFDLLQRDPDATDIKGLQVKYKIIKDGFCAMVSQILSFKISLEPVGSSSAPSSFRYTLEA